MTLRTGGEAAQVRYLHNALGQRTFKSEPEAQQTLPSETELGQDFISWLKSNFKWLFAQAQANTSIGTGYTFADGHLPEWAVLGEYDNGSAAGKGRSEYLWLPTDDGQAIPVGMFRNGKFFAIHTDPLGTPRLMTNEANQPVWQWPYSAFGNNKPTGILKATPNPKAAISNQPVLLKATAATEMNLRFPGQYADDEAGSFYNYQRSYLASQGRYTQFDPIGLAGGPNGYLYAGANPLRYTDPKGLDVMDNIANRAAGLEPGDKLKSLDLNDPCVKNYLLQNYGQFVANSIPSMSLMSLDPRSGARDAYVHATGEAVLVKGTAVGAIKGGQMGATAMGMTRATQVLGGVIFGVEVLAGLVTGYSTFATTAHLMAANACSCQK
ncbi:MAG: hypothetical protein KIS62_06860 [Ramlibacter sp.]|nr:hypothetical protein [Ramlibacter sp.]